MSGILHLLVRPLEVDFPVAAVVGCFLVGAFADVDFAKGAHPSYTRVIDSFNESGFAGGASVSGARPLKKYATVPVI